MENSEPDSSRPLRVTRRMFIITWLWGIASLCAIGGVLYHLFRERNAFLRNRSSIPEERLIREHFAYLTIDADGLRRFRREYRRVIGPSTLDGKEEIRHLLDTFLMSTDFFLHGADESRTIRYTTLYDVYTNPCYNPLPRHPIPAGENPLAGSPADGARQMAVAGAGPDETRESERSLRPYGFPDGDDGSAVRPSEPADGCGSGVGSSSSSAL
jgi:hypothetical protein